MSLWILNCAHPNHWLSHLHHTMKTYGLQIHYPAWNVLLLRQHNRYIMDDLTDQGLPRANLEKVNACRMFLQVMTLAEITDHTGSSLLSQVLTSYCQPLLAGLKHISQSMLRRPYIHPPSAACWHLWSLTICQIYTSSTKGKRLTSAGSQHMPNTNSGTGECLKRINSYINPPSMCQHALQC